MSIAITPFLRNALLVDAIASGATAVLLVAGADILEAFLGLPSRLLFWAGIALLPFVAMLATTARRSNTSRLVLIDIIAINALWVTGSFAVLVSGAFTPSPIGIVFVAIQALAVALFAELQFVAMRRSSAAA
ncbi:MAG TPA: hypothetical protein VNS34_11100 [Rhizobiaceae bacterium]|nr:hypothetical protein [Rhizobiaceae bacterium]